MKKHNAITILLGLIIIAVLTTACTAGNTPQNMTVTFSANLDCAIAGPKSLHQGENTIDMVGNIKDRGKIGLAVATFDSGKTLKDIQDWPSTNQPGWLTLITFLESPSDGTAYSQTVTISPDTAGPVYFVCFTQLPEAKIGALGPFEVKGE